LAEDELMQGFQPTFELGEIKVMITQGRTRTADEIAELYLRRIIKISLAANPDIADQAYAYKEQLRSLLVAMIRDAVREERSACSVMVEQWNPELALAIRSR
jgi:hypothetical protein